MIKKVFPFACLVCQLFTVPALAENAFLITGDSAGTVPFINAGRSNGTTDATALGFQVNGTEYMRLTATGSVGVGTTSPSERLDLGGGNIKMGYEVKTFNCSGECALDCSSGKQLLGGGCHALDGTAIEYNGPLGGLSPDTWECRTLGFGLVNVTAICANVR